MNLGKLQECLDILRPYYDNFEEKSLLASHGTLNISTGDVVISENDCLRLMNLGCIS